jgi:hypothetical protein
MDHLKHNITGCLNINHGQITQLDNKEIDLL